MFLTHTVFRLQYLSRGSNEDATITRAKTIVNAASAVSVIYSHLCNSHKVDKLSRSGPSICEIFFFYTDFTWQSYSSTFIKGVLFL